MNCPKCGKSVPSGSTFCPACGATIKRESEHKVSHGGNVASFAKTNKKSWKWSLVNTIIGGVFFLTMITCICVMPLAGISAGGSSIVVLDNVAFAMLIVYYIHAGVYMALMIPWTIFLIIGIVKAFKARPAIKPVGNVICTCIALTLGWIFAALLFVSADLATTEILARASYSNYPFPVGGFVLCLISWMCCLAASIWMLVLTSKHKVAVKRA